MLMLIWILSPVTAVLLLLVIGAAKDRHAKNETVMIGRIKELESFVQSMKSSPTPTETVPSLTRRACTLLCMLVLPFVAATLDQTATPRLFEIVLRRAGDMLVLPPGWVEVYYCYVAMAVLYFLCMSW